AFRPANRLDSHAITAGHQITRSTTQDLRSVNPLRNIIQICLATRHILHWLPTRERAIIRVCRNEIPENLTIRESATMVDGPPPKGWPTTSTVVTEATADTCPSSLRGGSCADNDCTECWNPRRKN